MAGKKKDPKKKYALTWGGPNRRQGRKPNPWPRHPLVINCTNEEFKLIISALSTRERAEILLSKIKEMNNE